MSALTFDSRRRSPDSQNLKLLVIPPNKVFAVCSRLSIFGFFTLWILRNFATNKVFSCIILSPTSNPFTDSYIQQYLKRFNLVVIYKQVKQVRNEKQTDNTKCVYYIVPFMSCLLYCYY